MQVAAALVRDPSRHPHAPAGLLTTDFARLRDDPEIAVVAEVMGGVEPTRGYVLELLRAGKSVVSANKQLLSRHGEELFSEAERQGVQLRFEASVCAAIPVIRVLRESMIVSGVHRIDGIVNGTTNFILSQMIHEGAPYAQALAKAQELGYAEADPTEDVTGGDAAAKIAILASIAFHTRVRLEEVDYVGIDQLDLADVGHASDLGYSVKLIATALRSGDRVAARVSPALLANDHPLAAVEGAFNAVLLRGESIREVSLIGPGAGGEETATAVIGDLLSVIGTRGTGFLQHDGYYRTLGRLPVAELQSPFYLRVLVPDEPGVLARVATALSDQGVSVAQVVQHASADGVHIVILTHSSQEGAMRAAADTLKRYGWSRSAPVVLPILERSVAQRDSTAVPKRHAPLIHGLCVRCVRDGGIGGEHRLLSGQRLGREVRDDHPAGCLAQDEVHGAAEELLLLGAPAAGLVGRADHDQRCFVLDRRVHHHPPGTAGASADLDVFAAVLLGQRRRRVLHLTRLPLAFGPGRVQRVAHRHHDRRHTDHHEAGVECQPKRGGHHLLADHVEPLQRHDDRPLWHIGDGRRRRLGQVDPCQQRNTRADAHGGVQAEPGRASTAVRRCAPRHGYRTR